MHRLTRWSAISAAALLAAACSNDSPGPTDASSVNADVATLTAETVGQDIEFMHGPAGAFGFGFRGGLGDFACTSFESDVITVERTCTYYDNLGATQDAYDSLTTASAAFHLSVTGAFDRGDWGSASFTKVRDLTVTGLEGQETTRTWNGTGSGSMTGVHLNREGVSVQMDATSAGSITDLVLPVPRTDTSWPLGGTIAYSISVTFTGGPHDGETFTRDVTVTFDGTQYATVTVNGETFTIDLARRRCTDDGDRHDRPSNDGDGDHHEGGDGEGMHDGD